MNNRVAWYFGRVSSWVAALLAAGGLSDPIKTVLLADYDRAQKMPASDAEMLMRLAGLVSWLESLADSLEEAERVKVSRLIDEVREAQNELIKE
jgi:hypothetical protein